MASQSHKKEENSKRLRYIRILERFTRSIINYLTKSERLSKEGFDRKVDNNLRYVNRVQKVALYKGAFSELETMANQMLAFRNSDESIEMIKSELLYVANQLEKSVNSKKYKKDKHSSQKYEEWE